MYNWIVLKLCYPNVMMRVVHLTGKRSFHVHCPVFIIPCYGKYDFEVDASTTAADICAEALSTDCNDRCSTASLCSSRWYGQSMIAIASTSIR